MPWPERQVICSNLTADRSDVTKTEEEQKLVKHLSIKKKKITVFSWWNILLEGKEFAPFNYPHDLTLDPAELFENALYTHTQSLKKHPLVFHPSVSLFSLAVTHRTPVSFVFAQILVKFQHEANGAGEGRREKHVGIFFPSQIFRVSQQQLHRSVTRCFPTLSDQKPRICTKSVCPSGLGSFISVLFFFFFSTSCRCSFEISQWILKKIFQG